MLGLLSHCCWGSAMLVAQTLWGAFFLSSNAIAQITPDTTLGAENSLVTPTNINSLRIDGGATRGKNLFHSFSQFNVTDGGRVYFANPAGIDNILTRVTGNSASNILGTLGVLGNANLFLLNPNGIIFGQNARLDIAGSFFASTANSLVFSNGFQFSTTNPTAPPLLTINVPVGLQFGTNRSGAIVNNANLAAGQDLTLIGNDITSLGELIAPRGNIRVIGVTGDVAVSQLSAKNATLSAAGNLNLIESQLQTIGNLNLLAGNTVFIRDSIAKPFQAHAGGNLYLQGNQGIDILALNHPQTPFQSGGNLSLVSNGIISGDAHFASGGKFQVLNLFGQPGNFVSKYDPIISSYSDVILGNYTGTSLKVETFGNITAGNITITGADTSLVGTDPDIPTLRSGSALILRAGLTKLDNRPNFGASAYSITNLGTLGGNQSYAYGINNSGQVVGNSLDSSGNTHAFLYSSGTMTDLGTLGGSLSWAYAINDSGQVVGDSLNSSGNDHAFLYSSGTMTDLGTFGGITSYARGINNSGQVVGGSYNSSGNYHAFLYSSTMIDLGTLGGSLSIANGINNSGQVVGDSLDSSGNFHAFLYSSGTMTDLGTLGGSYSYARGINNSGQVVGDSLDSNGNTHAFFYSSGTMTDLGTLGGSYSYAYGINNSGQVVGYSLDSSGNGHAFLYSNGTIADINNLIPANSGWTLAKALDINGSGQIVGYGTIGGQSLAFLLTPNSPASVGAGSITVGNISQGLGAPLTVEMKATVDINLNGGIMANGGNINLTSNGNLSAANSSISSNTFGTGKGGDINVISKSIFLTDGTQIESSTFGTGQAGNIRVTATDTLKISGVSAGGQRGAIASNTFGAGNSGNVSINAGNLILQDGGSISSATGINSTGQGGNLTVNAQLVDIAGTTPDGQNPSGLLSAAAGTGNAGNLTINTGQLIVRDGGGVSASSLAEGRGGNLTVNADVVRVQGTSANGQIPSALSTDTVGTGKAGDLTINTRQLAILDGAAVSVSTFGAGQGGTMRINATDTVQISGTSVTGFASGLYAQAFSTQVATRYALSRLIAQYGVLPANLGQGSAGEILVSANALAVTNGGNITSRSETQGNAGGISISLRDKLQVNSGEISVSSKGSGNGGNLSIAARSLFLDNQGKLLAETAAGDGGNISLQAGEFILLRHNSLISATAGGQGNGGNITINSPFIVAVPAENSDIIANAFKGRGGNININTFGIYGLQFRPRLTPRSDITASSDFGVNGTVQINTLGVDPSHGLNNLPINVVDAEKLVSDRCSASLESRRSQFVVFGRGGLPPTPQEALNGDALTINWATLPSTEVVNLPVPKLTVNQWAIADCFRSSIPK